MNADQYIIACDEILAEDYIESVVDEAIIEAMAEDAERDRLDESMDAVIGMGLIPFGDIRRGARFIALDEDGEPVRYVKVSDESEGKWNAVEIQTGRVTIFFPDDTCSLNTFLAD